MLFNGCEDERQRPVFEYSFTNPGDVGSQYPNMFQDSDGRIYMSWLEGIEEDIYTIRYTTFFEGQWTIPLTVGVSTNYFVNWADFPSIVGMNGNAVAAHWLRKIEGGPYAYNVNIVFPEESPRRWTDPITPHLDGTPTEHGFVSMYPISEERVLAVWLDGRHTEGRGHDEYEDFSKAMTLRSAEVSADGTISRSRVIDEAVCDCCQTDLVAVDDGFLVVYRNRTEEEVRDISIAKYSNETGEWSEPQPVWNDGWEIRSCPVNGPRIAASGDNVAVAWYTMIDNESRVNVSTSTDGGQTFDEPILIAGDESLGRVDLIMNQEGSLFVSHMVWGDPFARVIIREVRADGELSAPLHVGTTDRSRSSGFPRMKQTGDNILIAWTQTDPHYRLRSALVPLSDFWRQEEN